ncbi:MAG: hypothetical protein V4484_19055 [Pseudomonadota bacterium]
MRLHISIFLAIACLTLAACGRAADTSAEIERIKKDAQAAYPNDPLSAAKKANVDLSRLAMPSSADNKPQLAASAFLGYYWKGVYGFPTYCQQQGEALPEFTRNYISVNRPWHDAASKFPGMPTFDAQAKARAFKQAQEEIMSVAKGKMTSTREICAMLEGNAATVVERMKFSAVAPELYKQLLSKHE